MRPSGAHPTFRSSDRAASGFALVGEAVVDVWHSRDLLQQLTQRDIRVRYKQAVMGFGWAIFMPMLVVLSGLIVRFAMAQVAGGSMGELGIAGMAVKALGWAYFVGAIGFATPSLIASQGLVTKIFFPREVLPLSSVLAQSFDSSIGAAVLALLLPFLGAVLSPQLLWLPLLVVALFVLTVGICVFLSCANLFFRDVKYIVQVFLTFGIFVTPVFTEPHMFGPLGARLMMLNPVAPLLEGLRLSVAVGHNLLEPLTHVSASGQAILAWSPWYLAYSIAWAVFGFIGSVYVFRRAATAFAEYV